MADLQIDTVQRSCWSAISLTVYRLTFHLLNSHILSSDRSPAHCIYYPVTHTLRLMVSQELPCSCLSTGSPQKSQKSMLFPHLCLFGRRVRASESRVNTRNASELKPCVFGGQTSALYTHTPKDGEHHCALWWSSEILRSLTPQLCEAVLCRNLTPPD